MCRAWSRRISGGAEVAEEAEAGHAPGISRIGSATRRARSPAPRRRRGLFEQADGGTIFLDEIGELPPQVQAMLLRVLAGAARCERVGGEQREVDVRVVAATHRDLREDGARRHVPRGSVLPARGVTSTCRRCASARAICRAGRALPHEASSAARGRGARRSRPRRCAGSPPTPGRATCASCAARSIAGPCSATIGSRSAISRRRSAAARARRPRSRRRPRRCTRSRPRSTLPSAPRSRASLRGPRRQPAAHRQGARHRAQHAQAQARPLPASMTSA